MKTVIGLSARDREALFGATARTLGFGTDVIVEKDFWVCWILQQLFNEIPGYGPHLVFKGGTSLSKVYDAIKRFSEDVDITLGRELLGLDTDDHDPEKAPNPSQEKKRTKALMKACSQWVAGDLKRQLEAKTREALGEGGWSYAVDETDEDRLTLLFNYPSVLANPEEGAYIPRSVKIECGAKADIWPVTPASVQPYVAEAFPTRITGASVAVRALAIERTFWEKATILHAEALRPADKPFKANFARHYADTAVLADHPGGKRALADADLRKRVVAFKEVFFSNSYSNYDSAVPGTFMVLPAAAHAEALERDYRYMQREMYLGPSIEWTEVLDKLRALKDAINLSKA